MGFVEPFKHIPRFFRLRRELERRIRGGRVALVVLIDYAGFNMRIAATATGSETIDQEARARDRISDGTVLGRERESSRLLAGVERYGATAAVAAATFWLAYDNGTFGLTTRNTVAIALWWTIAVALTLGLWPVVALTRTAVATALSLAGLAYAVLHELLVRSFPGAAGWLPGTGYTSSLHRPVLA